MPREFTLQSVTSQSADAAQSASSSVDLGAMRRVRLHVQRASAAGTGSVLMLQTAPVQTAARFVDLGPPIDLSKTGDIEVSYDELMRFVRWRVLVTSGTATFSIDALAREV